MKTFEEEFEGVKDGDIFYIILPDSEAAGYGDAQPRKPYKVKVYRQYNASPIMMAYCFNRETGEIDEDTNSSTMVQRSDLFATFNEAAIVYNKNTLSYALKLYAKAERIIYDLIPFSELGNSFWTIAQPPK